jgi:outer membrane lipoprotein carrier protein
VKKIGLIPYIFVTSIFAIDITSLESFEASFEQIITDDHNKTIKYSGEIFAQKPSSVLWKYRSPINKSVYIKDSVITIVEPELEQAIVKYISDDIDFLNIMAKAEKIDENSYVAEYKSQIFNIKLKDKSLKTISYKDSFENSVTIIFDNQKENIVIDESNFDIDIPEDFDLIRE